MCIRPESVSYLCIVQQTLFTRVQSHTTLTASSCCRKAVLILHCMTWEATTQAVYIFYYVGRQVGTRAKPNGAAVHRAVRELDAVPAFVYQTRGNGNTLASGYVVTCSTCMPHSLIECNRNRKRLHLGLSVQQNVHSPNGISIKESQAAAVSNNHQLSCTSRVAWINQDGHQLSYEQPAARVYAPKLECCFCCTGTERRTGRC